MKFTPCLKTLAIGSMPHTDPKEAIGVIFECGLDILFWPQLPKRAFVEHMIPQYSEGMPFVKISGNKIWFAIDEEKENHLTSFYEKVLEENLQDFKISKDYAAGLYAFADRLKKEKKRYEVLKGHITGPLTISLGTTDQDKNPVYYSHDILDVIVQTLIQKARWQIEFLRGFSTRVILFIDEPILSAFGSSAYLGLMREDVVEIERRIISSIKDKDVIIGMHCCGNTDWEMVVLTGVDVISFDAYQYGRSISLYPDAINTFFEREGMLAWGIVPTSSNVLNETAEGLVCKLFEGFEYLEEKGFDRSLILERAFITPSCGAGSITENEALAVFKLLKDVQKLAMSY